MKATFSPIYLLLWNQKYAELVAMGKEVNEARG